MLLFSHLSINSVLDQFQQHAILTQLSILRHATYLLRQPGRQTHALADQLLSHFHDTIMHQNGVYASGTSSITLIAKISGQIVGFVDADAMHREMIYCQDAEFRTFRKAGTIFSAW
jgi:hypothetical protein